jgi:hypothetical protein
MRLGTLRKLPLWKSCVEFMFKEGVEYGKIYKTEFFEEWFSLDRVKDSMKFGLEITKIRKVLEQEGFYLSGRGQNGTQYVVIQPEHNVDVMRHYQRLAMDSLRRGTILGTTTKLDTLTDEERAKHENVLEKIATRQVLMSRADAVHKLVKRHQPKLLTDDD